MKATPDQIANLAMHVYMRTRWVFLLQRNRALLEGRRHKL